MSSANLPVPVPYPARPESNKVPQSGKQLFHFSRAEDIAPKPSTSKHFIQSFRESPQRNQLTDAQGSELSTEETKAGKIQTRNLIEWLTSLGLSLVKGVDLDAPIIDQFKDG